MKPAFKIICFLLLSLPLCASLNAAELATVLADCETCHGKDGVSSAPMVPTIAGYSAYYLTESLQIYQEKARPCPEIEYPAGAKKGQKTTMCAAVANLSKGSLESLGGHYAEKPFVRPKQIFDPVLASTGKALHELHCTKCHEDGGSSPDDDAGILAGQWMPFLEAQLNEYASGIRPMDEKMKIKIDALKPEELKALVHYYGSFQ